MITRYSGHDRNVLHIYLITFSSCRMLRYYRHNHKRIGQEASAENIQKYVKNVNFHTFKHL